jgi:hypothetical protein
MEQILKKYDNAEDDGFIGHDNLAREIVDSSSKKNIKYNKIYKLNSNIINKNYLNYYRNSWRS